MSAEWAREMQARTRLAALYKEQAALERKIELLEAQVRYLKTINGRRRLPNGFLKHGDETSYQRHIRKHLPFPEDYGGEACGCRVAHRRYESTRAQAAKERKVAGS